MTRSSAYLAVAGAVLALALGAYRWSTRAEHRAATDVAGPAITQATRSADPVRSAPSHPAEPSPVVADATVEVRALLEELTRAKSDESVDDETKRSEIRDRIVNLGNAATMPLVESLTDKNLENCVFIVNALSEIRDRRAVPRLIEVMSWPQQQKSKRVKSRNVDRDRILRMNCAPMAIEALGSIGDSRAVDPLIDELKWIQAQGPFTELRPDVPFENSMRLSNDQYVREALGHIRDPRAIEPLIAALALGNPPNDETGLTDFGAQVLAPARVAMTSKDPNLRKYTLRFLSLQNHVASAAMVLPLLNDPAPEVRQEAVEALGRLQSSTIAALLLPRVTDVNSDVRFAAATALFKRGDHRGLETLVSELTSRLEASQSARLQKGMANTSDQYDAQAFYLVKLAGEVADRRTLAPLAKLLKADDESIRTAVAESLGNIGGEQTVPLLVDGLSDWTTGASSADALVKLKWRPRSSEENIHFMVAKRDGAGLRASWAAAKTVLLQDIGSADPRIVESAVFSIVGLGRTDLEPDLMRLLDKKGTRRIAQAYLNAGNKALDVAARAWADKRGFRIEQSVGGSDVRWSGM